MCSRGKGGGPGANALRGFDPTGLFDPTAVSKTMQALIPAATPGVASWSMGPVVGVATTAFTAGLATYLACRPDDEDRCRKLLEDIYEAMHEIESRLVALYVDKHNLKTIAPAKPSPSLAKGSGSWNGHIVQLEGWQRRLRNLIDDAVAKRCLVPSFAWKLAYAGIPPRAP